MATKIVTPPAVEPVSLEEAQEYLRADGDDNLLNRLLQAAREFVEKECECVFVRQTWQLTLDSFPCAEILVPIAPLLAVTSIQYDDVAGVEQTLDPAEYTVDTINEPGWILPGDNAWPATICAVNAVRILFDAGYEASADSPPDPAGEIPEKIKMAILILVAHWYENRGNLQDVPDQVKNLCGQVKNFL